jgi:hypothetical protein
MATGGFGVELASIVACVMLGDGVRLMGPSPMKVGRYGADPELLVTRAEGLQHQAGWVKVVGATLGRWWRGCSQLVEAMTGTR